MILDTSINQNMWETIDKTRTDMINVSYYKYGPAKKNFGEGRVDALKEADNCILKFKRTGNSEYLLDAMNYLAFRVCFPMPGEEFKATDSDGSAGIVSGTPINMEKDYEQDY